MTIDVPRAAPRVARWHLLALLALIGLGLATLAGQSLGAPPPATTSSQRGSAAAFAPVSTPADQRTTAGCWITGDLVGEANPADVAAARCGRP
jgi:hypothetical protein